MLKMWLRHLEEKTCQSGTCPTALLTSQTEKAGKKKGTTGCFLSDSENNRLQIYQSAILDNFIFTLDIPTQAYRTAQCI